ncbi:hypothetical protein CEN50_08730, partial [Fischerella thermalis CCMEE 5268]
MKSKHQFVYAFLLQGAVVFSTNLLSVGDVIAQVTPSPAVTQQPQQQQVRELVQTEVDRAFGRTRNLINIWVVILTVFPVAVIASFWLLRRAVVREIVDRATQQFKELEELQNQLISVRQAAQNSIQQAKNITADLEQEAKAVREQIISVIPSEISQSKLQALTELERQIGASKQELKKLETEFGSRLSELEIDAQHQKNITLDTLGKLKSELISEISELQYEYQKQREKTFADLESSRQEFTSQLTAWQSEVKQKNEQIRENLHQTQLEFTAQLSDIQIETQQQKEQAFLLLEKS